MLGGIAKSSQHLCKGYVFKSRDIKMIKKTKQVKELLLYLIKSRSLISELVKKDFYSRYLGSYFGVIWAFVHPIALMLVYWFVFEIGFRSQPIDNFPFVLWLITGMIPWFFFSEGLSQASGSIVSNSFLVKKIVFRVSILPFIKVQSALLIHVFFIEFLTLVYLLYDFTITIYYLQIIYYLFALIFLMIGLSLIFASIMPFFKDIDQIINIVLQFGFWLTPIFWNLEIVPEKFHNLVKLNPVYYIVQGYRDTFINGVWFWEHSLLTPYFWIVTIILLLSGVGIYKKLRPHFADVL